MLRCGSKILDFRLHTLLLNVPPALSAFALLLALTRRLLLSSWLVRSAERLPVVGAG
jgi:hypothetical protein